MTATATAAIASDLNKIDLILAIGDKKSKRQATRQRKNCFAEIKRMNAADGLDKLTSDELLAELCA